MGGRSSDDPRFPAGSTVTLEELAGDPHPILARLRSDEPVSWLPALNGWLITRRDLATEVMRDWEAFTVDDPRFSTAQVIGPSMLSLDGDKHERHRHPFVDPFRHAAVQGRHASSADAQARRLVSKMAPAGEGDLRTGLAAPLAALAVIEALGFQDVAPEEIVGWYQEISAAVDDVTAGGRVGPSAKAAFDRLSSAVEATIGSVPASLLAAVAGSGTLATAEVVSNAAVIMFGGIVTGEGMIANLLWFLLSHPDQLDLVRRDRSLMAGAVEESLRLEPGAAVVDRYATEDVVLGGVGLKGGDFVSVSLAGANRDPDVFDAPDRFDVQRPNVRQHLAFAQGPHACLGIHLARLEAAAALNATLDLLPGLQLDADRSTPPEGLIFRSPGAVFGVWDGPHR